jgi:hypothetical protein
MARGFTQYGAKEIVGRRAPMSAPRRPIGTGTDSGTGLSNNKSGGVVSSGQFAGTVLGPGITQDRVGNIYVNGKPVQFTTGGQQGQTVGRVEAEAIRAAGGTVRPATDVLSSSGGAMPLEQYTVTNDPRSRDVSLSSSGTGSTGGRPFTNADTMEGRIAAGYAPTPNTVVNLTADTFSDPSLDDDGSIFGGGGGESAAQRLAREAAIRGAQNSASYLQQLQGGVGAQYAPLLAQIAANRTALEGGVNTNYQTALANLASRVGTAGTETTAAYDALRARLEAAAPRAYANLPAAQAPMLSQDAVSRYAQAIGAPTGAIGQAAVEAAVPYAGTADAYNRLISTLRANEEAGQASRLGGVEMGRTSTASRIAAQNLASQNALEVQKNAALAQILQAIQGQELGVSQSRLGYEQGLAQALAGIYGSGYVAPPPTNAAGGIDFSGVDFEALGRLMRGR